ncbi:MAG: acyl carrier protein [Oscillospiraceae bacterium]|nr:acyl carrier protein [Oscillospiraceae bacterium]
MKPSVDKVRELLAAQLDIDEDKITENTNISEDLDADSLDVIELMMSIEEEFGVVIEEDEIAQFKTVSDVARYIDDNA